MSTRRLTPEVKQEVVLQVVDCGHSVAESSGRVSASPPGRVTPDRDARQTSQGQGVPIVLRRGKAYFCTGMHPPFTGEFKCAMCVEILSMSFEYRAGIS